MTAMTMPLGCDEVADRLASYLEGELPDAMRIAIEAHASGCAECGRLLSEIDSLRMEAAALPLLEPSRDLWAGIAERIDARVLPLDTTGAMRLAGGRRIWRHPAVAAAALVLVTAGVTHLWTRYSYEAPAAPRVVAQQPVPVSPVVVGPTGGASEPAATGGSSVGSSSGSTPAHTTVAARRSAEPAASPGAERRSAGGPRVTLASRPETPARVMKTEVEPVFDREILKLRAIVRERRSQLDPRTVAVLEQSIAVIDSAIAQSRAALAKDPASGFLATQLNHSLEKKVELLRTAALLPART
jgi:hypothetical protein